MSSVLPELKTYPTMSKSKTLAHSQQVTPAISNPYIHFATAENTRKAYRSDIRHFENWGGMLPATAEIIVNYLQAHATTLNPKTLTRRLTALKNWHVYQGFTDPTQNPLIHKTLKGINNQHGKPANKAPALTPDDLQKIILYLKNEKTLAAIRDSALLQIGFFGAFRRSELINIHVEHIQTSKEGITILIPKSKTDQSGKGQCCALPFGSENLCPVHALKHWLEQSGINSGPIFRKINRWEVVNEKALTPLAVTQIIKKRAEQAGLEVANAYSSHSLRRGLATSASQKGASLKAIMRQGRWQHVNTVLGYFEEGQRFTDNAAACVLDNHS